MIGLTIGIGSIIVVIGYGVGVYNTIVNAKNDYEGQKADIGTEYQRRADLFLNLAKSVKSHKLFEKSTLLELTKARNGLSTQNPNQKTLKKMDSMFAGMKIQMEAYPELKSNLLYKKLMDDITLTEERILMARRELNNIVEDYNTYISKFPTMFVAKMFNARKFKYFEKTENATKIVPEIDV